MNLGENHNNGVTNRNGGRDRGMSNLDVCSLARSAEVIFQLVLVDWLARQTPEKDYVSRSIKGPLCRGKTTDTHEQTAKALKAFLR